LQSPSNPAAKIYATPPLCFFFWPCDKPRRIDERLLKMIWYSLTQFCVVRPITALIAVILIMGSSNYHDGIMSPSSGYLSLELVNAASMLWALWFLFICYKGTVVALAEHKTTAKFACIKLGLFFSTLQKGAISLFFMDNMSDDPYMPKSIKATTWNNFLLTLEMCALSFLYLRAFPVPSDHASDERILGSDGSDTNTLSDPLKSKSSGDVTVEEELALERERQHDVQVFSVSGITFSPPTQSTHYTPRVSRIRSSSGSGSGGGNGSNHRDDALTSKDMDLSYQSRNSTDHYGSV